MLIEKSRWPRLGSQEMPPGPKCREGIKPLEGLGQGAEGKHGGNFEEESAQRCGLTDPAGIQGLSLGWK